MSLFFDHQLFDQLPGAQLKPFLWSIPSSLYPYETYTTTYVCVYIFISPSTELGSYLKLWHMGRVVWPWTLSQCMISRALLCLTPRIISTRVGVINFSYYSYSKLDDQWYNWWVVPLILWKFWNWLLTKIKLSVLVQQARVVVVVGMRYRRRSFTTKGFVFTFSNC